MLTRPMVKTAASFLLASVLTLMQPDADAADISLRTADSAAFQVQDFDGVVEDARAAMMRDPVAALELVAEAEQALAAQGQYTSVQQATISWLRAEALTRLGRPAEALPAAQGALNLLSETGVRDKLYGDVLVALGRGYKQTGEYGLALENYQSAYEIFRDTGDTRSEAIVLQSIASIYKDAGQYDRAVEYYLTAMERHPGDIQLELAATNNLGNVYRELSEFDGALVQFERARAIAAEMQSPILEARILNNIASLNVEFDNFTEATAAIEQAFTVLPDESRIEWTRFLWAVQAEIAYGRGEYAEAARLVSATFDGLSLGETSQHFAEFHESAADIYEAAGNWQLATEHLRAFYRLDTQAREVMSSANLTLLGAEFHFAEQELEIARLRSAGLESELELADARFRQRLILVSALLIVMIGLTIALMWRQRAARERQVLLERMLFEDGETGLPSRSALQRQIDMLGPLEPGMTVAVALGIDRYDQLEAVLGFSRASELQRLVVERIANHEGIDGVSLLSPGVVGFMLDGATLEEARYTADRITALFRRPVELADVEIDIDLTAGLDAGDDPSNLIKRAVIAIQQSRDTHQTVAVFDAEAFGDASLDLSLIGRMTDAMRTGKMTLHYQPKLNLRTNEYDTVEALSRWNDDEHGFVPPDTFIRLAEETGRIRDLTEWGLRQAVSDQARMAAAGFDMMISFNISGALVSDPVFAEFALQQVKSARGKFCFEITETAAMQDPKRAMATLRRWMDSGVRIAIDDYGSGLSSLSYLKMLPCHELKLDRAFVQNIASNERDRMLVKSTADLAHSLGLEMTAEGVEDDEGLALLKLFGCDSAQGFGLSRPLPLAALTEFLRNTTQQIKVEPAPLRSLQERTKGSR